MKPLEETIFTIVGTGLMGASLALALRGKVKTLLGVDSNPTNRQAASPHFDEVYADFDLAVAHADVVVLATPIWTILRLLEAIKPALKRGTLVIDLGSTKQQIVAAMDSLPDGVFAIGGHPMCGKEKNGPAVADGAIYHGCPFILCPSHHTTPDALTFAQQMIVTIGARPMIMSARDHDCTVAVISHLPHLLAIGLVASTQAFTQSDDTAWRLASSGFRDTSRLAASESTMLRDIFLTNREALLDALALFRGQIASLESAIKSSDELGLQELLERTRQARLDWPAKYQE